MDLSSSGVHRQRLDTINAFEVYGFALKLYFERQQSVLFMLGSLTRVKSVETYMDCVLSYFSLPNSYLNNTLYDCP